MVFQTTKVVDCGFFYFEKMGFKTFFFKINYKKFNKDILQNEYISTCNKLKKGYRHIKVNNIRRDLECHDHTNHILKEIWKLQVKMFAVSVVGDTADHFPPFRPECVFFPRLLPFTGKNLLQAVDKFAVRFSIWNAETLYYNKNLIFFKILKV